MPSINKVILLGRVGADAKLGSAGERPVVNFSLATRFSYRDPGGVWKKKTTWHQVAIFGARAKAAVKHIKRGKLVAIEGHNDNQEISGTNDQKYKTTRVIADDFDVDRERSVDSPAADGPGLEPT